MTAHPTSRTNLVSRVTHARPVVVLEDAAANEPVLRDRIDPYLRDEYVSGLDLTPSGKQEREQMRRELGCEWGEE